MYKLHVRDPSDIMRYQIIYSGGDIGRKTSVKGEVVEEKEDSTVYHTDDTEISALTVSDKDHIDSKLLLDNGDIIKIEINHIREMKAQYELYIVTEGFRSRGNRTKIEFYGAIDEVKEYDNGFTNILINRDTVIEGSGHFNLTLNNVEIGEDVEIFRNNGDLATDLGCKDDCVVVCSPEPIEEVLLFDEIG